MRTALKALKANKLKTLLILFSLTLSICSIFLISSISNGVIYMYSSMLKSDGDIIITQAKISDTFFSNVDIKLIDKIEKIEGVKKVSAVIVGASPVEELPIVAVYGATKNRFSNYSLIKGSYPKQNEVLVGKSIYDSLKNKESINISKYSYKISGVFKSEIGFENGGVVLNINQASKIFNKSASFILVNTNIQKEIDQIIKATQSLSNDIEVKSTNSFIDNYNQFEIIRTSSKLISSVAFCMGLLSVVSIMSITVNQRKSEFGIKKAIGISTGKIINQIVLETAILGFISFLCAFFIANMFLLIIEKFELFHGYINAHLSSSLSLTLFICSLLMAVIGSIIPALNVSKIDPIILMQGDKIW